MEPLQSAPFWFALAQIAAASLLLAGDSAVLLALGTRRVPEGRRQAARRIAHLAAVGLRIALCPLAAWLVTHPFASLAAGLLLAWTALRLMLPERQGARLPATRRGVLAFILLADIAAAAANAVAIAGAARGSALLIALGLLVSLPLLAMGGRLARLLARRPPLLAAGAGLLGWIAGGLIARDTLLARLPGHDPALLAVVLPPAAALLVVVLGTWRARRAARRPGPILDLAPRNLQ